MIRKNILMLFFLSFAVAAFSQAEIEEVSVTNLTDLNSIHEDFLAVPYGEGIMYNTNGNKNKCDTCGYHFNFRYAQKKEEGDCSFSPSVAVPATIQTKYNFGAPTFSRDGKMMILSQNSKKPSGEGKERGKKLKLVSAEFSDQNSWVNFTDLPINAEGYETTHPSLSADGQKLFFASNREGGQGGMDIWMVAKQGDSWGISTNLGPTVNTLGNEIFPSISADGTLHFSSNKVGGLGQLDIYSTKMEGGVWSSPENMGAPINSVADDMGMVTLADGESGYLTSNRAGGKGKDDIYCWKVNSPPVLLAVEDATNSNRLQNALVKITGPMQTLDYQTDANGGAKPNIVFRRKYTINVEKEGYEPWSKEVSAKELAAVKEYIVPLIPRAYQMKGDVKLLGSEVVVPGSKVVLHNITTGEKREVIADENGKFSFDNIHCFEDYEFIAYKDDRESAKVPLPATAIDCTSNTPSEITLRIPVPPPPPVVACACNDVGILSLPYDASPKVITALGSRPQFGNSHSLDAAGFYNKLKRRYDSSKRNAAFLDELFQAMGYANGFADAGAYTFNETTIANGRTGNMGYTKSHRIKYVQLKARFPRDLEAFRVSSANNCDTYFMKTCGNLFFFCDN